MENQTSNGEMTVLVTGGSGFLGGHAIVQLLELGYSVRTTVRDLKREPEVRASISLAVDAPGALTFFAADLNDDAGWTEAVAGCDYVLHIASPFPNAQPKDAQELIVPARDGALRVIRAGLAAGVKRIVMTSSVAAVRGDGGPVRTTPYTEADWTDPDASGVSAYAQSKTIAERAAWDLVDDAGARDRLAVVNPSLILGPVLGNESSTSLEVIERMLKGMPAAPKLSFGYVDVRDVAAMHIAAMTAGEAGGERFIASGPSLWLDEASAILREALPEEAKKAPTRVLPKSLVRVLALFDPGVRTFLPDIGKKAVFSAGKAESVLGWDARPVETTIVECARSLIARNG
ncbi:MAG: aldehyde reductase [Solirubrobacterales bacterium]